MGTLILPVNGAVYVDANVLIYRVEAVQPHLIIDNRHITVLRLFRALQAEP